MNTKYSYSKTHEKFKSIPFPPTISTVDIQYYACQLQAKGPTVAKILHKIMKSQI